MSTSHFSYMCHVHSQIPRSTPTYLFMLLDTVVCVSLSLSMIYIYIYIYMYVCVYIYIYVYRAASVTAAPERGVRRVADIQARNGTWIPFGDHPLNL